MKKALIIVDMQKDFVDGSLGTPAAQSIVPAVAEKIRAFRGDALLVTLDQVGAACHTGARSCFEAGELPVTGLLPVPETA